MDRLTTKYCDEYVPKELCSIDRLGGADDCDLCFEYCKAFEGGDGSVDCNGCVILACFDKLGRYEDTGLAPEQIREMDRLYKEKCKELAKMKENHLDGLELAEIWSGLEKLRKYEVLRQQGRMPVLPCKVGQNVYIIDRSAAKPVMGEVVSIRIGAVTSSLRIYIPATKQHINRAFEQVGRSVFFTQEAAEKKRSGRGGYLMMPLVANIPKPCDPEWKRTTCPSCGQECWERPLPAGIDSSFFDGVLCTECALKKGLA